MKIKQLSVFLENNTGHLGGLCKTLADAGVNLQTITIAETKDYGIVRAIVDDSEKAQAALKEAGMFSKIVDVIAVEVDDKPGALFAVLQKAADAGLNLEYMYALTRSDNGKPVMVMAFEDVDAAAKLLG